jgi:uncharacterized membrane protein
MAERVASAVLGGTLVGLGLAEWSLRGLVMATVGGVLLARGLRGRSRLYRALGSRAPDATDDDA